MEHSENGESSMLTEVSSQEPIKLRSYQQEMLEASLQRNVIVVMETGSGKTHVAVSRIRAELERTDPDKLVWFLTPKVALSSQQYHVLDEQLHGFMTKTLTGQDQVDTWTDQTIWDGFLKNVRVVVGTPKVLEEALTHGFVRIERLQLLVFDEAHHCIGGNPMSVIMKNFYHPAKARGGDVPNILGLTASPVMSEKSGTLQTIEANLDALAVTPKQRRSELEDYVHPPEMVNVVYASPPTPVLLKGSSWELRSALDLYHISNDPYAIELASFGDEKSQRKLSKLVNKPNTYCYEQLKALLQRSTNLHEQLGSLAAEWYVRRCIERFSEGMASSEVSLLLDLTDKERSHLEKIFAGILSASRAASSDLSTTEKARSLIHLLEQHCSPDVRCIVFVEQRAVVAALAYLLRSHPKIGTAYSIGTFVGTSTFKSRKSSIADLSEPKEQQQDLLDFRTGKKNLMIATNALEEGIDVAACNLIICFDRPKNLVSFVQCRGRARQKESKYVIFLPADDPTLDPGKWQRLEAEMKQAYMEDERQLVPAEQEDEDDTDGQSYTIKETQAQLTLNNAKAHLYHFCDVGTHNVGRYVDLRPEFETVKNDDPKPWTARVTLPSFVHPKVRTACSSRSYGSEAAAIKDASFVAYVGLYEAGLMNKNWLPLVKDYDPEVSSRHIDQPSIVRVSKRLSSWENLFGGKKYEDTMWYAAALTLAIDGKEKFAGMVWLPTSMPCEITFDLYWNQSTTYGVRIRPLADETLSGTSPAIDDIQEFTHVLLKSVHGARMSDTHIPQLPVLFCCSPANKTEDLKGCQPASSYLQHDCPTDEIGLVHVKGQENRAYIFSHMGGDGNFFDQQELITTAFPKRKDFLHPLNQTENQNTSYTASQAFPISECTIDRLPMQLSILAAFVPSIMHRLDVLLLASQMSRTLLSNVKITNLSLIVEAIASPSALETFDYNRLEFLGDSILKFFAVRQVMANHLTWPERYLTLHKGNLVSNNFLASLAQDENLSLGQYILTQPFTGAKWRPISIGETLEDTPAQREMSSKVLADVMEALIGAAFVDGGFEKAFTCTRTLIGTEDWLPAPEALEQLLQDVDLQARQPGLALLEQLIGYHFNHQALLLEALTHVSFRDSRGGISYERLEFLGDAVLDAVIVPKLFAHARGLRHWELHRVHGALVSADLLAFCCMNHGTREEKFDVVVEGVPRLEETARTVHLHDFMRAGAQVLQFKQRAVSDFERLGESVRKGLEGGKEYPWPELMALRPPKFLSDLLEAVLGAIYLDSRGDLEPCEAFVEELGILRVMRRILDEGVETATPREQVGILADRKDVEYLVSSNKAKDGTVGVDCRVVVGGSEVASATGCGSRNEAEARAARAAVRVMEVQAGAMKGNRKRKLDVVMRDVGDEDEDVDGSVEMQ